MLLDAGILLCLLPVGWGSDIPTLILTRGASGQAGLATNLLHTSTCNVAFLAEVAPGSALESVVARQLLGR